MSLHTITFFRMLHRNKILPASSRREGKRSSEAAVIRPTATDTMTQEEAEDAFLKSLDYNEEDYVPPVWSEYDSWGWDKRKKRGLGSIE